MKISKFLRLNKTQRELDFVDIDLRDDTPLFIDPMLIANKVDRWSQDAHTTIENFFHFLIVNVKAGRVDDAKVLFSYLGEPKETGLGLSLNSKDGNGMGEGDSERIFKKLITSKAIETGLVGDLEDTVIFVERIGRDKVSDMTTNIIRKQLLEYTQRQCRLHDIKLTADVPSGMYWDKAIMEWRQNLTECLVINDQKILLVPKSIVVYKPSYTPEKYHRHFVLNFLKADHLRRNTRLVQSRTTRKGVVTKFVTKKSLIESEAPFEKNFIRKFTLKNPKILEAYKKSAAAKVRSLDIKEFEDFNLTQFCDFLITRLKDIPTGTNHASEYHDLIIGITDFLFYPDLVCPQKEDKIHNGRKRIDLTFDNSATSGFFYLLHKAKGIPCSYIMFECKNYSEDLKNPELDQISGRFSPNRGKFGIITCRQLQDDNLFLERCKDTYYDQRGLILYITDSDLILALEGMKTGNKVVIDELLTTRMRKIIMS